MAKLHPALKLSALDALPLPLRHSAKNACKPNATGLEMSKPFHIIDWATLTPTRQLAGLPLCYTLLDPALVPTVEALEENLQHEDKDLSHALHARMLAMELLASIATAQSTILQVGTDIWSRFWPWSEFFRDIWPSYFPLTDGDCEELKNDRFLLLISGALCRDPASRSLLRSTSGFFTSLAISWKHVFPAIPDRHASPDTNTTEDRAPETIMMWFTDMLAHTDTSDDRVWQEILHGFGASTEDLCSHVLALLDFTCGLRQFHYLHEISTSPAKRQDDYIVKILSFARGLVRRISRAEMQPPFSAILVGEPHAVMPMLMAMLSNLARAVMTQRNLKATVSLTETFLLLHAALGNKRRLLYALDNLNEFWPTLFHIGSLPIDWTDRLSITQTGENCVTFLLRRIIPRECFDRTICLKLRQSIARPETAAKLARFTASESFRRTPFFSAWKDLTEFLRIRYEAWSSVSRHIGWKDNTILKICDNLECCLVADAREFRRCSACQMVYYCSKYCQKADWKRGNHRIWCIGLRGLILAEHSRPHLHYRVRNVIRTQMNVCYLANFELICARHVLRMVQQPKVKIWATYFDFSCGNANAPAPGIVVTSLDGLFEANLIELVGPEDPNFQAELVSVLLERVHRGAGRLSVHWANITFGAEGENTAILVPLRSSSAALTEVLRNVAKSHTWPRDLTEEDIMKRVPSFRALVPDLVEYHC
ncbi:Ankyrin repeat-containing protein [Mycena indigotica]|uniref:Ankyrin repeat-containing protein n=1 Tax=Mycena indigotica TaxID=2126181 RepID=A0A8H6S4F1_9AGAR|nr:Ankyrin repeat-containing protein [Mycena indigotica]KAF7292020.1 Ankyrin repeat-containing protein [Mycena indigotica]